jgi:hypothetical protein
MMTIAMFHGQNYIDSVRYYEEQNVPIAAMEMAIAINANVPTPIAKR